MRCASVSANPLIKTSEDFSIRPSTENLLYGPRRALVKIDTHAFRRVQAVMDAVRNTYTPVSRARQEEARPPREPLIDRGQPLQVAHEILRHRARPAIDPGQHRLFGNAHHSPKLRPDQAHQPVVGPL